jgi:hypothetical protein
MVSAPFDNEQYRNQGDKATGKPNCYQKVIICAGCPIFVYGDAIFALPEAFFFGYIGAIFERMKIPFYCLPRRKICVFYSENRRCAESTFLSG